MSNYTIITNFAAKDGLASGNPAKLIKGSDFTTEYTAVQTALNTKVDGSSQFFPDGTAGAPSVGFTNNTGTGMYNVAGVLSFSTGSTLRVTISATGLLTASAGLTVTGGAFTSRGITDNATATAVSINAAGAVTTTTTAGVGLTVNGITGANTAIFQSVNSGTTGISIFANTGSGAGTKTRIQLNDGTADLGYIEGDVNGSIVSFKAVNRNNQLDFWSGSAGGAQRMLIDSTGNVNVPDGTGTLGPVYAGIPQNAQAGTTYTLVLADANKHIYKNGGAAITTTIPANASVAFKIGTTVTFVNQGTGAQTIQITTDTLIWAQNNTAGTRTLAIGGVATALKITATAWVISGTGLT